MDILITEEQLKKIISEQQKFNYDPKKVAFDPTKDNVPKSDYLGKGGEFEGSDRGFWSEILRFLGSIHMPGCWCVTEEKARSRGTFLGV